MWGMLSRKVVVMLPVVKLRAISGARADHLVHGVLNAAHGLEVGNQRQGRDDDQGGGDHGGGPGEPFVSLVVLHSSRGAAQLIRRDGSGLST